MLEQIYVTKEYLIHPPFHGSSNHRPKLVSYNNIVSIYEDIFVPAIYGILCQSNPTVVIAIYHCHIQNLLRQLSKELLWFENHS